MKRLMLAVTATLLLTIGLPALSAAAHTDLESSDPAEGAQLAAPPSTITLVFGDAISAEAAEAAITVGGQPAQQLTVTVIDDTLTAPVAIDVGRATGSVRWRIGYRVLSLDGHPVSGVIDFTVTTPEPAAGPASPVPASTTSPAATDAVSGSTGTTAASPAAPATPTGATAESSGTMVSSGSSLAGDATPTGSTSGTVLVWVAVAVAVAAGVVTAVLLTRRKPPS